MMKSLKGLPPRNLQQTVVSDTISSGHHTGMHDCEVIGGPHSVNWLCASKECWAKFLAREFSDNLCHVQAPSTICG
jgi:hypothetical protein